ncbi:hypothetical protein GO988_20160 [Hymenobacter sp. HMF4947]|uniref:Uncharacterized protein n=1 Tax=Hymenobacter ginkgonis TaxID=2682976 RepID=A0A7K1TJT3_9BACT|nr:hypothetical protein [Hymenobacter ginkgonis]MVN78654.1 hypothetical protein [Hymenobacter ginkgonis]
MPLAKSIIRLALGTAFLLLIPLVAMQFTQEVKWNWVDFVAAGSLLFGTGLTYLVIAQKGNGTMYRVAVGVAVAAGLLLVWANLAVGLVGSEHNPANLLYGGVLAVAIIGALAARLRPLGMSRAMFAAALTYVVVTAIALFLWTPSAATAEAPVGLPNVIGANALFAALWATAGWLFRLAGRTGSNVSRRLA